MKKSIALLLVVILGISLLASCGGGSSNDPNIGTWTAVSVNAFGVQMGVDDVFENGASIELKANGKCTLNLDGEKVNTDWSSNNGEITIKGDDGETYKAKVADGKLTLDFDAFEVIFEKK